MEASSQESQESQESERTEASSEDSSPSRAAARGLRHREAKVVYNEKQLAKRASTDDDDDDADDDGDDEIDDDDDDEVDDEARRRPLELWTDGEATSSAAASSSGVGADEEGGGGGGGGGGVSGQTVFGFKTLKRKDALAKSVTYSTNAAIKDKEAAASMTAEQEKVAGTPKKGPLKGQREDSKGDIPRTPCRGKAGRKPPKSHLLKTPHRLRRRMDQGIDVDDDSDPSFDEADDDDDDDEDSDDDQDDDDDAKNNNNNNNNMKDKAAGISTAPAPSLFDAKTTPSKPKKSALKKAVVDQAEERTAAQQSEEAESYFDAHKSSRVYTSDHTLGKLETPKLAPEQVSALLADSPSHHAHQIRELIEGHASLFRKWMLQLAAKYSVLLYGLGSKRQLMETFRQNYLAGEYDHVTVNGYFPGLTLKQVFSCIIEELFGLGFRSFKTPLEQLSFLADSLRSDPRDFFLVFHNIDGVNLRKEKTQQILSQLASLPGCHLIASVDHINAPLLWDQTKISKFRWVWYDATTFCPYIDETSYETSLMIQQSGQLALSSLLHVIKSLTPNAKKIFVLLATEQLALGDDPTYQGMSFQDLYQRCRAEFLVNSDLTLKAQLTEFKDHKLIRVKKGGDGVEYLTIPLDNKTIIEFMEDYES